MYRYTFRLRGKPLDLVVTADGLTEALDAARRLAAQVAVTPGTLSMDLVTLEAIPATVN